MIGGGKITSHINEENYENAIIDLFSNSLGYKHLYGPDVGRNHYNPLYLNDLTRSLNRINPNLPSVAMEEAIIKLQNLERENFIESNKRFTDYLQNGITVNYFYNDEQHSGLVKLIDFQNVNNNTFTVANQWTIVENSTRTPDVIVFLNGFPLVVFELKSPSREETDVSEAFKQLRNYMYEIPSLFIYNAFLVMSDMLKSKAGTITATEDRFMEWKTKDGNYENTRLAQYDTFIEGIFDKGRLLDIIKNFICFSDDKKVLAAYHQYFAVKKAIESTLEAIKTDGKGGVFWHTQGSGKSLSMIFYAHLLQDVLNSPTIIVLTDRNDLDNQLYEQFSKCKEFLRQDPEQAENRNHLKQLLMGRQVNGIIFTTAQKFEESMECLSERKNLVVITDEAHRSHFIDEWVDVDTGQKQKSFGLIIRESLPNATYIGFTGTPISSKDRSTKEVFGEYIDIYDMTQAVEDGATLPVYYESRVINLKLDDEILHMIDAEYDLMAQMTEERVIEKSKKELSRMESILGADQTITALCEDIIKHYEDGRQQELSGKAMIVAYSRAIAMDIHKKLLSMRPNWTEKIAIVMTESNSDPEKWRKIIGNKKHRNDLAKKFKNDDDPMKIAIVVDMWLTGFDVPSLTTMYVYKPMARHTLMQAITRVNRVYKDKEGGLVVDYVGIATALKQAMKDYTNRDKQNYGEQDIAKTALPKFLEKLEVCRNLLYDFDYSGFVNENATDKQRMDLIKEGVNFLSELEKTNDKKNFIKETQLLYQALSLCRSLVDSKQRLEASYFKALKVLLERLSNDGKTISLAEINMQINELLKASVKSGGVINLFSNVDAGFSLFDPKFLEEISKMKERNLALEVLRKLLLEQVLFFRVRNIVKSERFSDMLSKTMNAYIKGMLTNEEVIAELMRMAKELMNARIEGQALGLSDEELAFYDALTKPDAVKEFYQNEELIAISRELTDTLRKNRTIDWQKKEGARAHMRRLVKKLLKEHRYPPEGMDSAIATVIEQCELWTDKFESVHVN